MTRTKYQYQIIRFIPNRVIGEFVNVGIIMYEPTQQFLASRVISKYGRLNQFFPGINGSDIVNTLKLIKESVDQIAHEFDNHLPFDRPSSLEQITDRILPKDDSALIFTEIKTGIAIELESAFDKLTKSLIHYAKDNVPYLTDKDVWSKYYRPFFDQYGIADRLRKKVIKTDADEISFEHAYKNGHWNCLESANFELKTKDSIENKVFKIIGKLDALSKSTEPLEYHVLAHLSGKVELDSYIRLKLNQHSIGKVSINLIEHNKVEDYVKQVKSVLDEHDL